MLMDVVREQVGTEIGSKKQRLKGKNGLGKDWDLESRTRGSRHAAPSREKQLRSRITWRQPQIGPPLGTDTGKLEAHRLS